jgi:type IV pilus assembly protein PilX
MTSRLATASARQQGMALITSLLLLLVVTILAVSMFRSFGIEGKIAGNVREKQRALMAAEDAQQFAEWWLSQGTPATLTGAPCSQMLDGNAGETQVCSNPLLNAMGGSTPVTNVKAWPYFTAYKPKNMTVLANTLGNYYKSPGFYISYMGHASGSSDLVFLVDAVGYGADANTVAVVESTFAVKQGPPNFGANPEYPPVLEVSQ